MCCHPGHQYLDAPVEGLLGKVDYLGADGVAERLGFGVEPGAPLLGGVASVAGIYGVGPLHGVRVYTGGRPEPLGTMAERTLVPSGWAVPVPDELSSELAAALVNPAMSSGFRWSRAGCSLARRSSCSAPPGRPGHSPTQIALHLGAGRVIAAGRNAPLADVTTAWTAQAPGRLVITMD